MENMKKCLIISGGDFSPLPETIQYEYSIACDKGLEYANRMGISPDLIIGDFDSYCGDLNKSARNVEVYPSQKDDSDTMLAIKHALSNGFKHIYIICALGGRMDHTIANLQSMNYVANNGGICEIIDENEHLIALTGPSSISLPHKEGYSLSIYSMSDKCKNVCISGAGYNVENIALTNTFPIGLSNYWKEDNVTLSLESGILLISMSKLS